MSSYHRREESKIQDGAGCSLAHIRPQNTSYHQCYFYCACYVLGNSVTIFFFFCKTNQLHHTFCYPFSEQLSVRVPYVLGFRK